ARRQGNAHQRTGGVRLRGPRLSPEERMTMSSLLQSIDARSGQPTGASWPASTPAQIDAAVAAAAAVAGQWGASPAAQRAALLRALAAALEADRETLVPL